MFLRLCFVCWVVAPEIDTVTDVAIVAICVVFLCMCVFLCVCVPAPASVCVRVFVFVFLLVFVFVFVSACVCVRVRASFAGLLHLMVLLLAKLPLLQFMSLRGQGKSPEL